MKRRLHYLACSLATLLLLVSILGFDVPTWASEPQSEPHKCAASRARDIYLSGYLPVEGPKPVPQTPFYLSKTERTSVSAWQGRGLVLNVWATWCPPCVKELPALTGLKTRLKDRGVDVIIVNTDKTDHADVSEFLRKLGITNLSPYIDRNRAFMQAARIASLPTTLLINAQGHEVAAVLKDADWDDSAITDFLGGCIGVNNQTDP